MNPEWTVTRTSKACRAGCYIQTEPLSGSRRICRCRNPLGIGRCYKSRWTPPSTVSRRGPHLGTSTPAPDNPKGSNKTPTQVRLPPLLSRVRVPLSPPWST